MNKYHKIMLFVGCLILILLVVIVKSKDKGFFPLLGDTSDVTIIISDSNMLNRITSDLENNNINFFLGTSSITISNEELGKVKKLELNNANIEILSGIEAFYALEELNISNNKISDASLISSLTNLKKLQAYGTLITDIDFVSNLVNLEYLDLSNNLLVDTSTKKHTESISNLTNLEYLNLSHNTLKYTNGLNNLTHLEELNLYDNIIENISGISNLSNLKKLSLGNNLNNISNLANINTLISLVELDYSGNETSSIINYLSNLLDLEVLKLDHNNIENISNLQSLNKLKTLILYDNRISNISPLLGLSNLEELNIGKNNLTSVSGMINNNQLVWPNLGRLSIAYNQISESGDLNILCNKSNNRDIELDYENITDTTTLPHTDNGGVKYVTYEDFGARADGVYDDYIAIRNAHTYANSHNVEVRADGSKTYHIYGYYALPTSIQTSVNWNNATIVIHDEDIDTYEGRFKHLLSVTNYVNNDIVRVTNPSWTINKNTKEIPELEDYLEANNEKGYTKYYVRVENNNKRQFSNSSEIDGGLGDYQNDIFIIDSDMDVLNDIKWDFDNISSIEIIPLPNAKIVLQNARFVTNNQKNMSEAPYIRSGTNKPVYYNRNIQIYGGLNMEIVNLRHTYSQDEIGGSYYGFLLIDKAGNITLRDSSFFAKKFNYMYRSTYDIVMNNAVNVLFDNVTSNDLNDTNRWGVFTSNYSKDVSIENSSLNIIDAHCGIHNLNVKKTKVGGYSIAVVGSGNLNITSSQIYSEAIFKLRGEYGATWNGTVNIKNSTLIYNGTGSESIMSYDIDLDNGNTIHNYGYDLRLPDLFIENLTIDNTNNHKYEDVYVIPNFDVTKNNVMPQSYFTNTIYINGYEFINNYSSTPKIRLAQHNLDNLNTTLTVTNLTFKTKSRNYTHEFNINKAITLSSILTLQINEQESIINKITIYKDDEIIVDDEKVEEQYNYEFTNKGHYKIVLTSIDNDYQYTSAKEYEFDLLEKKKILNETKQVFDKNDPSNLVFDTNIDNNELNKDWEVYIDNTKIKLNKEYMINDQSISVYKSYLVKLDNGAHKIQLKKGKETISRSFAVIDTTIRSTNWQKVIDSLQDEEEVVDDDIDIDEIIDDSQDIEDSLKDQEEDNSSIMMIVASAIATTGCLGIFVVLKKKFS